MPGSGLVSGPGKQGKQVYTPQIPSSAIFMRMPQTAGLAISGQHPDAQCRKICTAELVKLGHVLNPGCGFCACFRPCMSLQSLPCALVLIQTLLVRVRELSLSVTHRCGGFVDDLNDRTVRAPQCRVHRGEELACKKLHSPRGLLFSIYSSCSSLLYLRHTYF